MPSARLRRKLGAGFIEHVQRAAQARDGAVGRHLAQQVAVGVVQFDGVAADAGLENPAIVLLAMRRHPQGRR